MELNDIYKAILIFAGLEADNNGFISAVVEDTRTPALIGGLRMVLPTHEHLRNPDPTNKAIFHPLSESITRGESEMILKLKSVINIRLNYCFGIVGQSLLSLVASPELHKNLSPDQAELLLQIKDADETTRKNFTSLMLAGIKKQPERIFVNIRLQRGGTVNGKRHARAGIVTFPVLEELEKDDGVFGVKLRAKDREAYKQLYHFMLTKLSETEGYNYGSDSLVAPWLDALMMTAVGIASNMNDLLDQYAQFIDCGDRLTFNGDWLPAFENLEMLRSAIRQVPTQALNEGKEAVAAPVPAMVQAVSVPTAALQAPPVVQAPVVQTPVFQPVQTMPANTVVKTDKGLDFRAMSQGAPGAPNLLYPQLNNMAMHNQMQQQQQHVPLWAQGAVMAPVGFQGQFNGVLQPVQGVNPFGYNQAVMGRTNNMI